VDPSAAEQGIFTKFLTNENVRPAEILNRFKKFGDETRSRTQVCD
jgi:hypothetical protein